MLRDVLEAIAEELRDTIGSALAADDIDAEIEPRFVVLPSEGVCLDLFLGAPPRDSVAAGFGDISGAYVVTVRARVTTNDNREMQDLLTDMNDDLHALCVPAAIEATDPGNFARQVVVDADGFSGILDFSVAQQELVGCTWRVLVVQGPS